MECVNVDVTAAGCSHPVSSACHYQPPPHPPPHPPSSSSFSSFKAAATAAACHAHFNTPDSFDRLYGLIILNIYRSHFPKPSMFIQHLGEHSMAPFSAHTHTHTHPYFLLFLVPLPLSSSLSLSPPTSPRLALLQPSFSMYHRLNKKERYFCLFLPSRLLSGHPFLQWLGHQGDSWRVKPGSQADTNVFWAFSTLDESSFNLIIWSNTN